MTAPLGGVDTDGRALGTHTRSMVAVCHSAHTTNLRFTPTPELACVCAHLWAKRCSCMVAWTTPLSACGAEDSSAKCARWSEEAYIVVCTARQLLYKSRTQKEEEEGK